MDQYGGESSWIYHELLYQHGNLTIAKKQKFREKRMDFWHNVVPSLHGCNNSTIHRSNILTIYILALCVSYWM